MKIAIVKLSAMGDIVHAMVALQFIKQKHPNIQIDWIVEKAFAGVLEDNPDIDNILTVELKALKKDKLAIFKEIKKIKNYSKNNYDLVIDAQGLLKSAIVAKLLGKKVAGFSKNSIREKIASIFYNIKIDIDYAKNTIDRNVTVLGKPLNVDITPDMIINKKPFLFFKDVDNIENLFSKDKKNIIFVIGSTWESRNYPKEKFAQIANELKENIILVWGNEEEKERAKWIELNSKYVKIAPKGDLNQLKAIISKADLVIGNDTGPTHMAWGLNIPSITIFGPTPINRVYRTKINRVVKSSSKVNPCKLDKNDFSIREIEVSEIVNLAYIIMESV